MSLSLRTKIYIGFVGVILVVSIVAGLNLNNNIRVSDDMKQSHQRFNQLSLFLDLKYRVKDLTLMYMDSIVDAESRQIDEEILAVHDNFKKYVSGKKSEFYHAVDTDEERKNLDVIMSKFVLLTSSGEGLFVAIKEGRTPEELGAFDDVIDGTAAECSDLIEAIVNSVRHEYEVASADLAATNSRARTAQIAFWMVIVVGGLLTAHFFSGYLARRLNMLAEALLNEAFQINHLSEDLERGSSELSSTSTEQAAAIQETASSVNEISAMVERSAESAKVSQKESEGSRLQANKGKQTIEKMLDAINEISQGNDNIVAEVEKNNQDIRAVTNIINEIAEKTKVINDIVFQTKLLSFNASVEAARAGEHGKGFAVVAEEVGNLAQVSGQAANSISSMLENSIAKVNEVIESSQRRIQVHLDDGKEKVTYGVSIASECREALEGILSNIDRVDEHVKEISRASEEQSKGTAEISTAISQLDEASQKNASISNSTAKTAQDLKYRADQLSLSVDSLKSLITGQLSSPSEKPKTETPSAAQFDEDGFDVEAA